LAAILSLTWDTGRKRDSHQKTEAMTCTDDRLRRTSAVL
jgi:hypothetical protein